MERRSSPQPGAIDAPVSAHMRPLPSSPPSQHYLEIDLKYAKKKNIPGVRHLFCSGHYCAFEYADHVLRHEKQELFG